MPQLMLTTESPDFPRCQEFTMCSPQASMRLQNSFVLIWQKDLILSSGLHNAHGQRNRVIIAGLKELLGKLSYSVLICIQLIKHNCHFQQSFCSLIPCDISEAFGNVLCHPLFEKFHDTELSSPKMKIFPKNIPKPSTFCITYPLSALPALRALTFTSN